jgi:hypothetical protein
MFVPQSGTRIVKSWEQIKAQAESADYIKVAKIAGCSSKTVKYAVNQQRPDNFKIQKIFSEYLTFLQRLTRKYNRQTSKR